MAEFRKNDLIALAELFRLHAKVVPRVDANNVLVLVPVYDCERLAVMLDKAAETAPNNY